MKRTFLAKCNYNNIMPEVRHRPVIPHTVFKYNYLSIKIKNLCYFSLSQLLILLPLLIRVSWTPMNLLTYCLSVQVAEIHSNSERASLLIYHYFSYI